MTRKTLFILVSVMAFPLFFLTSCDDKGDGGMTYEEWLKQQGKDKDKEKDDPDIPGEVTGDIIADGYTRTEESGTDTYQYPEAEGVRKYDWGKKLNKPFYPVRVKNWSGSYTTVQVPFTKTWEERYARLVHYMADYKPETVSYEKYKTLTNKWGSSLMYKQQAATGRFRTQLINGRWYLIDPDGYVHINRGVTSFRHGSSSRNASAFNQRFGSDASWVEITQKELAEVGIHSTGAFSTDGYTPMLTHNNSHPDNPIILCPSFGFLGQFKTQTKKNWPGGNSDAKAGLVFESDWESFCVQYVNSSAFAPYRGRADVLGFFSDNEIPLNGLLKTFLGFKDNCAAYKAACDFMKGKGLAAEASKVTTALTNEFCGIVAENYYKAVKQAIQQADPGMLYVGSRLHGTPKNIAEVVAAAGRWCDIISINYYSEWWPKDTQLDMWETQGNKPFLITEFYVKAIEDCDLPSTSGAGWVVPTQAERAYFFQNFALGLLESKYCVGWTWFKYQDDDGSDNEGKPANKGLYDNYYNMYPILGKFMAQVDYNVYDLIRYFDGDLK